MFGIHSTVNLFECGDVEVLIEGISEPDQHFSKGTANVKGIFMNHFKTVFTLAIIIALLYPPLTLSQLPKKMGHHNSNVMPSGARSLNLNPGIYRDFPSTSTRHPLSADFESQLNSLAQEGIDPALPGVDFMHGRHQRTAGQIKRTLLPSAQVSVIDTAIVYSTRDTTRHLYKYNSMGKITSDETHILNDNVWVNFSRYTFEYDAKGNLLFYTFDTSSNGQWIGVNRQIRSYDGTGKLLIDLSQVWLNGEWTNASRYSTEYGEYGNHLSELYEQWFNDAWVKLYYYSYTYDTTGNMLSSLGASRSDDQWENESRSFYTYDSSGHRLISLSQHWFANTWENENRTTFTYDLKGLIISRKSEYWTNNEWNYSFLYIYEYDERGNLLARTRQFWSSGQWVNTSRDSYSYDALGNCLVHIYEEWTQNQWKKLYQYTYTYDNGGRLLSELYEDWGSGPGVIPYRILNTYDANGNLLIQLREFYVDGEFTNDGRYKYIYDAEGNLVSFWFHDWYAFDWRPDDRPLSLEDNVGNEYFYYGYNINLIRTTIVVGVVTKPENMPATYSLSQNYPNPFNPTTEIHYQLPNESNVNLSIYNVLGQQIRTIVNTTEQPGEKTVQIDANGLPSGIYFYQLDATSVSDPTKHFSQTRKMVLVK
jgi:hypothetical protein